MANYDTTSGEINNRYSVDSFDASPEAIDAEFSDVAVLDAASTEVPTEGVTAPLVDAVVMVDDVDENALVAYGREVLSGVELADDQPVLSREEAEQLTEELRAQILRALDAQLRLGEMAKRAYQQRVWEPLGYESWDEYAAAEFTDARLTLSAEQRSETIVALGGYLSQRAIASVFGIGRSSVNRTLKNNYRLSQSGTVDNSDEPSGLSSSLVSSEKPSNAAEFRDNPVATESSVVVKKQGLDGRNRPSGVLSDAERRERNARIWDEYDAGRTQDELAGLFGLSQSTIHDVLAAEQGRRAAEGLAPVGDLGGVTGEMADGRGLLVTGGDGVDRASEAWASSMVRHWSDLFDYMETAVVDAQGDRFRAGERFTCEVLARSAENIAGTMEHFGTLVNLFSVDFESYWPDEVDQDLVMDAADRLARVLAAAVVRMSEGSSEGGER